jgi:hypothetical protein
MGTAISRLSCLQTADTHKGPSKIRLLHRPTSLSTTHDEMTQAVRLVDKVERRISYDGEKNDDATLTV